MIHLDQCNSKLRERIERQMSVDDAARKPVFKVTDATSSDFDGLNDIKSPSKNETAHIGQLQDAKPKRDKAPALVRAIPGEASSNERPLVRFIGYRARPLDPDNFAASCKDLLDGLRHAGILAGDAPWQIRLETEQVRVATRLEERTEIEIDLP